MKSNDSKLDLSEKYKNLDEIKTDSSRLEVNLTSQTNTDQTIKNSWFDSHKNSQVSIFSGHIPAKKFFSALQP